MMSTLMSFSTQAFTPKTLWDIWPEARFETTAAPCLRHARLMESLQRLESRHEGELRVKEIGQSVLGRPIQLVTLGKGDEKILLWSQMHGDEPSATPALLDIANYLLEHADDPVARSILDKYTLLMIPMLNPDGAEVYERFNAQGIDINRDALRLVTPEGRLLKRIRDEYEPMLGFNLHDQNRRHAVGDTGQVAVNALLSVSGDPANTLTPGRKRTKRACVAIVEALEPFFPGGMARYDEGWSPRAFGDNITAWGTPVVLIESGGVPPDHDLTDLTRNNFVAILMVLKGLAEDDLNSYDPQVYERLDRNQSESWSDVMVTGGSVLQPGTPTAYRADLAFNIFRSDQQIAGCADVTRNPSEIYLLGDSKFHGSGTRIDASGNVLLPSFDVGIHGWERGQWLDTKNLARLARLGVGMIYWAVNKVQQQAALDVASGHDHNGLPRIKVLVNPAGLPPIVLTGPPEPAAASSWHATLQALGVKRPTEADSMSQLWMETAEHKAGSARLRKSQAASFLIVKPAPGGQINDSRAEIVSIWLDGQQVTPGEMVDQ
ncbi:MAG: M14 family zinc carboxypeptidase [Xanthomonadales bacterium]|nr:M14 family zinc carboxypeptidase [Xanthomonadales bacterium]